MQAKDAINQVCPERASHFLEICVLEQSSSPRLLVNFKPSEVQ